jgi:hypothetical protein
MHGKQTANQIISHPLGDVVGLFILYHSNTRTIIKHLLWLRLKDKFPTPAPQAFENADLFNQGNRHLTSAPAIHSYLTLEAALEINERQYCAFRAICQLKLAWAKLNCAGDSSNETWRTN